MACFVVEFEECDIKDPDEFIRINGIVEFQSIIRSAALGTDWLARCFVKGASLLTPKSREDFVRPALEFSARFLPKNSREKSSYLKIIAETLECTEEVLLAEEKKYILPQFPIIADENSEHRLNSRLVDYLKYKQERDGNRTNSRLGYEIGLFQQLEQHIFGIQPGFYIVAADTNVGKTAFLTNIFLETVLSNKHITGIYVSLDDGRDTIINRFLSILSSIDLISVQMKQEIEDDRVRLKNAYSLLVELAENDRLNLKDISEIPSFYQLEGLIQKYAPDKPILVAIDGLYNLNVSSRPQGIREENIYRASEIKRLVDTYEIPIITTGELRKRNTEDKNAPPTLHDLMETSKFAYNANLVWLLYPQSAAEFNKQTEPLLVLDYAKNKLSHFKGKQILKFTKAIGRISETRIQTLQLLPPNGKEKGKQ